MIVVFFVLLFAVQKSELQKKSLKPTIGSYTVITTVPRRGHIHFGTVLLNNGFLDTYHPLLIIGKN